MSSVRDSYRSRDYHKGTGSRVFLTENPGLLQVVLEPYLTVARNPRLVDSLGTFYTLYFVYIPLDYLKYTSPTLKNSIFPPLMQFLTWTSYDETEDSLDGMGLP
jgi:hypothetical protein